MDCGVFGSFIQRSERCYELDLGKLGKLVNLAKLEKLVDAVKLVNLVKVVKRLRRWSCLASPDAQEVM